MSKVRPRTKLVVHHPVHGYAIPPPQDVKVSRRNARERNRVKTVNSGFEMLKKHIPSAAPVKKMSKVNILNQAVEYIEALQCLLKETPPETPPTPTPTTTSYPQVFPHPPTNFQTSYNIDKPSPSTPSYHPENCYPPLTPISPNTMYYPHYSRSYESGYDSQGDSLTDLDRKQSWHHPEYQLHHQQTQLSNYNRLSPTSPSSTIHSPNPHYVLPIASKTVKCQDNLNESSGEEDDILDAIAEWQQH